MRGACAVFEMGLVSLNFSAADFLLTDFLINTRKKVIFKIILKDNANRYSCQGKIQNFSIIKRPEKKLLSKKLAMSFATFKQKSGLSNI